MTRLDRTGDVVNQMCRDMVYRHIRISGNPETAFYKDGKINTALTDSFLELFEP